MRIKLLSGREAEVAFNALPGSPQTWDCQGDEGEIELTEVEADGLSILRVLSTEEAEWIESQIANILEEDAYWLEAAYARVDD